MDSLTIDTDEHQAWVEPKDQHENRKPLTQDISAGNTMGEECLQNKLFGYLLDRFRVGWICFDSAQDLTPHGFCASVMEL